MSPAMEVIEPGLFTTVQDRGRYGYQRFGVPVSGAMDQFALRAANLLVGNDENAAALEMTVIGPTVEFKGDAVIAVTGADLTPMLDGSPMPRWEAVRVAAGSRLSFHGMADGIRGYLAVSGGIDVPEVMGSRSTYVKGGFGGLNGSAISSGDVLDTLDSPGPTREMPPGFQPPVYGTEHELRVILGPQDHAFDDGAISTLLESTFTVSLDSDRMGYRLEGPQVAHRDSPDIISEGNAPGAVQVSGDGVPTVLMADRGTTGGYTKIAAVITADVGRLAQAVPGESVRFAAVSHDEAVAALEEQEAILAAIAGALPTPAVPVTVVVDGETLDVTDEQGEPITAGEGSARAQRATAVVKGLTYSFDVEVRTDATAG